MKTAEVQQELIKVQQLLAIEKQEDVAFFESRNNSVSFKHKRKLGICWYPVILEKNHYDMGERLIIKVSRSREHIQNDFFQSGKPAKLFCINSSTGEEIHQIAAIVNNAKDQEMHLTLSCDDLPIWVHDGLLGVQLLFDDYSYQEMEFALSKVIAAEEGNLLDFKKTFYGFEPAVFATEQISPLPQLNESQNKAVEKVFNTEKVSLVHGPPGTGKTTTVVASINELLKKQARILVCAPSNAAVDLLVEKLVAQQVSVVRLGHPARVTEEVLRSTLDMKVSQHHDFKLIKSMRKQAEEYFAMGGKWKRNFGSSEREQRKLLLAEARKLKQEADQMMSFISDSVLEKSQVIACTLVGASNMRLRGKIFEYVFIDEAAQALEPACWIPLLKAKRAIFAGDHQQLPPTVKSFEANKKGLSVTLFEKIIERQNVAVLLKEQYRMNEQIMAFPNQELYNNSLIANKTVKNWKLFDEDVPVEFIDTAGTGFFEEVDPDSKSNRNKESAELLFKHLVSFIQEHPELLSLASPIDIGVITPYRAQVEILEGVLGNYKEELQGAKIKISTVDAFQGQERSIIYIDLVRSNDKGEIGFLSDIRRMNVAMTRAKKKLVVIGDSGTITSHPFYEAFLNFCQDRGFYRSAFEMADF